MIWLILGGIILFFIFLVIPPAIIQINEDWGLPILYYAYSDTVGKWLMGLGPLLWFYCVSMLVNEGKGTPFLDIPTTKLVIKGPYRYSRNPLYVAYMLVLFGLCLFRGHMLLFVYCLLIFLVFDLFIRLIEEPGLRHRFGTEYEDYLHTVPRWFSIWPKASKNHDSLS